MLTNYLEIAVFAIAGESPVLYKLARPSRAIVPPRDDAQRGLGGSQQHRSVGAGGTRAKPALGAKTCSGSVRQFATVFVKMAVGSFTMGNAECLCFICLQGLEIGTVGCYHLQAGLELMDWFQWIVL